jgi:hypothetical protein
VALLAQTFSKFFFMADYYANTSEYAQNCVNKARPAMHCNGQCQLMKKLQQAEKKDQENPERKGETKGEVILSSRSFFTITHEIPALSISQSVYPQLTDRYSFNVSSSIFHPPKL